MKNRAFLVLMEQLVMVLVFSIAAAVCMGLFVRAGQAAEDTARLGTLCFWPRTLPKP